MGRNFLLLGSYEAIVDVVEKRGHFNDRPVLTMIHDLMNLGWVTSLVPYGDHWRQSRKLIHMHTHTGAAVVYQPTQLRGARRFVIELLDSEASRPSDKLSEEAMTVLTRTVRLNLGLTGVDMIYSIDACDVDMKARFIDVPEAVLRALSAGATPGRFLVDSLPFLRYVPSWFPGAGFRRYAQDMIRLSKQMRDEPLDAMKERLMSRSSLKPMAASMLESARGDEELVKDAASTFYLAANDTTVGAVRSYLLAAVRYPDVQRRLQEELDRVVGRDRLPVYLDKPHLPYLEAVMRECFRWLPVLPFGVAHGTMQDDEYRGYFIPKGTFALPLQWSLLHDPIRYPSPSVFSPERHLSKLNDGSWTVREDVTDPRKFAFGFGRRVCPGVHLAEQGLFALVATVAHTIKMVRVKDYTGREVVPEVRVSSGALSHALPFPYELHMREDAENLVNMCRVAGECVKDKWP